MARIYRKEDRLVFKIDDITIKVAPLSLAQKTEVQQALVTGRTKGDVKALTDGLTLSIKYALKDIKGVEDTDGKEYKLTFEGDELSDECLSELMSLDMSPRLQLVCAKLVSSIPTKILDENGKPVEGIEFVSSGKDTEAKK